MSNISALQYKMYTFVVKFNRKYRKKSAFLQGTPYGLYYLYYLYFFIFTINNIKTKN